jgi:hypothetical protein
MGFPYGAVGPLCRQGNTKILTHDFTHRTHMEIFDGEYYPPQLTDWWMDDWIARTYGSSRTRQSKTVEVRRLKSLQKHGACNTKLGRCPRATATKLASACGVCWYR